MTPQPKAGALRSKVYLAFVRRLPCCLCDARPASPHHYPPKGRGEIRDDRTMPACLECHRRCHGETIAGAGGAWSLPPVSESLQLEKVQETRLLFWDHATAEEWAEFSADRAKWLERRGAAPAVPF